MHRIALKCGRFYRSVPRSVNKSVNNYNKSVPRLQYSTTSSIGSKSMSNRRDENGIDRTILRRNVMQSTESKNANEVEGMKFFADENIIQINFSDGQVVNFNTTWLRDSCDCDKCLHPMTKTKLMNSADNSDDLSVDRFGSSDDTLEISWRNGLNEEHVSHYNINWLKMFSDVFGNYVERESEPNFAFKYPNDGIYSPRIPRPEMVLWDSTQIKSKQEMTTKYNDFMNSDESLRHFLTEFCRFGFAFLEGVPHDKNAVLAISRRIAYEKRTSYGSTFDVAYNPDPNAHMAYTGCVLGPHVDLPYRERSPGVQMLHCMEQASVGGASTLVDGIKCAEQLRGSHLELFNVLSEYPVLFSFCDKERGIWFREKWPIIGLNADKTVKELHYNQRSMRAPLLPLHVLDKFYAGHRKLTEMLKDERFEYRFFLRPGDLVFYNNRRILHGRDEFDETNERRLLIGCYMDLDEVNALHEKLDH